VLVPRHYVANAVGAMSLSFNGPSVIGPPIAGFLIAWVGVASAFYINTVATLAVVVALRLMHSSPPGRPTREGFAGALRAGFAFLAGHAVLRDVVIVMIAMCLLVRPYVQLMPAYAAHVVFVDARGLGMLLGATGIGGFLGALATAIAGNVRRGAVWLCSAAIFAATIVVLGFVHSFAAAIPLLALAGFAVLSFQTSSMVMLQTLSPDAMRGRAVAVSSMITLGLIPAGSLIVGTLAAAISLSRAYVVVGVAVLAITAGVAAANRALRKL
jgi:predicted MFS family arabinose efflux permease